MMDLRELYQEVILEITRRTIGWVLPCIMLIFMCYALFGPHIPIQILKHRAFPGGCSSTTSISLRRDFRRDALVVSTVVFHFVLFGVIAQRMGLGQFFVDFAAVLAGRYTGGRPR